MHRRIPGELILTIAALIWGTAFVAQTSAAEHLGSLTINGIRSLIAVIVLTPVIMLRPAIDTLQHKRVIKGGAICGILLCVAANLQQYALGMKDAVVGKVSFLTALYMVLVPVIGMLFGRKTDLKTWISVIIAAAGLYFITGAQAGGRISAADLLSILCAAGFALQILAIDHFAPDVDPVRLSRMEFLVCGTLSLILGLIFEQPRFSDIMAAKWPILYCAVFSSGIAYTFQMVGQKRCRPQVASLIMSLESVFGALSGMIILKERLSLFEITGCVLMSAAVVLTQINIKPKVDAVK